MPLTKERLREYQRRWVAERRASFFRDKQCKICFSTKKLELHHRDPSQKIHHAIWSWEENRRLLELLKCDILCEECHNEKTKSQLRILNKALRPKNCIVKLSDSEVEEIRASTERNSVLAKRFKVAGSTISLIRSGRRRVYLSKNRI